MTALTRPRGPLPRRVYWTRRVLVLGVALLLVVGVARLLGTGGSGGPTQTAATVGGSPTSSATSSPSATVGSAEVGTGTSPVTEQRPPKRAGKQPLPQPDGPCDPADLVVSPFVRKAHAGDPIKVVLDVSTKETPACTWEVSPHDLFVTIADDKATIWTSQQCPTVLPSVQVVPRQEKAARTSFVWDGKASDEGCSQATDWARMGSYRVTAVARGSVDPQDSDFVIGSPTQDTIIKTRKPHPTPTPTSSSTDSPTASPTGSAEPQGRDGAQSGKPGGTRDR